jgi:outer membrane protein TolC
MFPSIVVAMMTIIFVGAAESAEVVTIDAFLDTLQRNHPLFAKERLTPDIEREAQKSLLGAQDWNLSAGLIVMRENPAISIGGPERTDVASLSAGIERAFWKTGGRFAASISTGAGKMRIDPFYGVPESFYQHEVAVSYTHPLLRNRGGVLDRLSYDLKSFDIDVADIEARENEEVFLAEVSGRFIAWALLSEQERIVGERLRLSLDELERTKRKREANLVDQVDVIRAEDAVILARESLVLVSSQRKALQAELALLCQWDGLKSMEPAFDLYAMAELPPLESALLSLEEESRLIQAIGARMEQLNAVLEGYHHTLLPDLYLTLEANTKNFDDDVGASLELDRYDVLIGLALSYPLQKREANALVEKTTLEIRQLGHAKEEIVLDLGSALANLHVQISGMDSVLALNQEQIASAEKKTEEELNLYNQGRGSLTFVLQSRDSEQAARLLSAQNAATYQTLLIQYQALLDKLR